MTAVKQAVLDPGMTHVMAPDERRRRLASGADLHASKRYDGAQPCYGKISVYPSVHPSVTVHCVGYKVDKVQSVNLRHVSN